MSSLHQLMPDGRIRTPGVYAAPALKFDLAAEIRLLHAEEPWQAGHTAKTIAKYSDFRVVLVAIKAGAQLVQHKTYGRVSIQVLSGHILLNLPAEELEVGAGGLLTLDRELSHDVQALEDSVFLLTIAWPDHERQPARIVRPNALLHAIHRASLPRPWQQIGVKGKLSRLDSSGPGREQGLDCTLAETFPCSDSLSSIPNPVIKAG